MTSVLLNVVCVAKRAMYVEHVPYLAVMVRPLIDLLPVQLRWVAGKVNRKD